MNKLEQEFWERLKTASFAHIWREPFKLRLAGRTFYTPDFAAAEVAFAHHHVYVYEAKGFMRDDAAVKLKVAASLYPCFTWVLARKQKRQWSCRFVDAAGIRGETWIPEWLR